MIRKDNTMKKALLMTFLTAISLLLLTGCTVGVIEWQANNENNPRRIEHMRMMADFYRGKKFAMDDIFPVFIGIPDPDEHKAFEWIKKAADTGDLDACFETATMYATGKATEKNDRKAAFYMQEAWKGYRTYYGNRYDYRYVSKFSSWLQNNKVDPVVFRPVIEETINGLLNLNQASNNDRYRKEIEKIAENHIDAVLALKDNGINPFLESDTGSSVLMSLGEAGKVDIGPYLDAYVEKGVDNNRKAYEERWNEKRMRRSFVTRLCRQ